MSAPLRHRGSALGLIGAAGLLLAACQSPDPAAPGVQSPVAESDAAATPGTAADPPGAELGQAPAAGSAGAPQRPPAASPGKPTAPLAIRYEFLGEPSLGLPLEIAIEIEPQSATSGLMIELRGSAALTLASPSVVGPFEAQAGETVSLTVTVIPTAEGRHHLSVLAEGIIAGQSQARSLVVPLRVGPAALPARGATGVRTDESGERVRSLPAEESR